MASKLASQLEYLKITDLTPPPSRPNLSTVSHAAKQMPKLRNLVIDGGRDGPVESSTLKRLLGCAPGLGRLEYGWKLDKPGEILSASELVPNLCALSVYEDLLIEVGGGTWDSWMAAFARTCPKLRQVNQLDTHEGNWEISRGEDGKATVTKSRRAGW
ncbi:hypothetical protein FRC07_002245 [Ceratobasidium sp. 392]|nr:hypothetical protein FRC07_002245 [Ceratobasidium sp. 392]